jgi:hypothetical protein
MQLRRLCSELRLDHVFEFSIESAAQPPYIDRRNQSAEQPNTGRSRWKAAAGQRSPSRPAKTPPVAVLNRDPARAPVSGTQ